LTAMEEENIREGMSLHGIHKVIIL